MSVELGITTVLGGIFVLSSYYWIYQQDDAQRLWVGIDGHARWIWYIGGSLTALGFLYLSYKVIFELNTGARWVWTYLAFFLSAGTWGYITLASLRSRSWWGSMGVLINLLCTAITSVLMYVWLFYKGDADESDRLLQLSAILLIVQHAVLDLTVWYIAYCCRSPYDPVQSDGVTETI